MALDTRWKNPQGSDPKQLHLWAQELIRELRKGEFFSTQVGSGITNAQLAEMAAWTIKARNNAAAGAPEDVDRPDLTAAAAPAITHELLGFLSTNELRRLPTGIVGGLQLLNSGTVTNQATLDISLTAFTAYPLVELELSAFVPATDDVELWLRFSTDGGSNFAAANYAYAGVAYRDAASTDVLAAAAAGQILVAGGPSATEGVSNTAGEFGADAAIGIFGRTTARYTRALIRSAFMGAGGSFEVDQLGGQLTAAQDTDAVRLLFESGNISTGSWRLYGYA